MPCGRHNKRFSAFIMGKHETARVYPNFLRESCNSIASIVSWFLNTIIMSARIRKDKCGVSLHYTNSLRFAPRRQVSRKCLKGDGFYHEKTELHCCERNGDLAALLKCFKHFTTIAIHLLRQDNDARVEEKARDNITNRLAKIVGAKKEGRKEGYSFLCVTV